MAAGRAGLVRSRPRAEGAAKGPDGQRTLYVDSETGRDSDDGQSPDHAWRSLDRVNAAELKPGDTVRFKSGGVWRGSLVPASGDEGAPVTYTSFGQGPKPLILGSLPRNRPEDWVQVRENIWATLPMEYRLGDRLLDLAGQQVEPSSRGGGTRRADVRWRMRRERFLHIVCTESGSASNHVQLWGPELRVEKGACLLLTFRARSSKPFRFPGVEDPAAETPRGRGYAKSGPARPSRGRGLGHLSSGVGGLAVVGGRPAAHQPGRPAARRRRRSTSSRKACTPPRPTSPIR